MKALIFMQEDKLTPRGGPFAVGYYLNEERRACGDTCIEFLPPSQPQDQAPTKRRGRLRSLFSRMASTFAYLYKAPPENTFDFSPYDIVHFHETSELYKQRGNLKNYRGTVILTSHCPVPYHRERYLGFSRAEKVLYRAMYSRLKGVDRYAFSRADYIFFPCQEAEEPYADTWPEFSTIADTKRDAFRYVLTGIPPAKAAKTRAQVCEMCGIDEGRFIVSYVGRHNKVKGYARLLRIGEQVLSQHPDVQFLVAGKETPLHGLQHERWHEVGWTTDPHSYIAASDVFVLPNEATYFDIVMLEVLSLGCIVVASRTGGNKYFEKNGVEGIFLFDTEEEAVAHIAAIKAMTPEQRAALGAKNKAYYEAHLTSGAMYRAYVQQLTTIYEEEKHKHG